MFGNKITWTISQQSYIVCCTVVVQERLHTLSNGWMFGEIDLSLQSPGDLGNLQGKLSNFPSRN